MGCCISTSRDNRSPYHSANASAIPPTDSRLPITHNTSQSTPHNITQASASSILHPRVPHSTASGAGKQDPPNKPLQSAPPPHQVEAPTVPTPAGTPRPAQTRTALTAARNEFFETRTAGRPEMWAAVRLVCDLVGTGALSDAQAVLNAAGGTCPSGVLWGRKGGCYDERGERYVVPVWCVGTPTGLDEEDGVEKSRDEEDDERTMVQQEERPAREGKGKGKAVADQGVIKGKKLKIKVRLSHTARDVIVVVGDEDKVELLVQRAKEAGEIPLHTKARIVHLGQMVTDDRTLAEQGWQPGHVLNMFVFDG